MNNEDNLNYEFHVEEVSPTYPMIVKKYEGTKTLSSFIHESSENEYILTGPFG